jgi:hypothetical protein
MHCHNHSSRRRLPLHPPLGSMGNTCSASTTSVQAFTTDEILRRKTYIWLSSKFAPLRTSQKAMSAYCTMTFSRLGVTNEPSA